MTDGPVRVLLVDDSALGLALIKAALSTAPDILVVGTARNGKEALTLIPQLEPHVICTDRYMPQMDGLELVQEVMAQFPRPILVVSSAQEEELKELLAAGALGVIPKPPALLGVHSPSEEQQVAGRLIQKIRLIARVPVISRRRSKPIPRAPDTITIRPVVNSELPPGNGALITAIGASTGGPQVLKAIFSGLPASYPLPILCVQHISKGFLSGLVDWLGGNCPLPVTIASPGEIPRAGVIYFPPEGAHLKIDDAGRMVRSYETVANGHYPSVNVLFESVAHHYGNRAIAVLLTGMGSDGADGMKAIRAAGGVTIAQEERSCAVFGMPKAAIDLGAAQLILPPAQIAANLVRLATRSKS